MSPENAKRALRQILKLATECRPDEEQDEELSLEIGGIIARAEESIAVLEDRQRQGRAAASLRAFEKAAMSGALFR